MGGVEGFLVASLHLVCFYPEWDKRGWGLGRVGEGTGRREKVEEGRVGKREAERAVREAKPKGKEFPAVNWPTKRESKLD